MSEGQGLPMRGEIPDVEKDNSIHTLSKGGVIVINHRIKSHLQAVSSAQYRFCVSVDLPDMLLKLTSATTLGSPPPPAPPAPGDLLC